MNQISTQQLGVEPSTDDKHVINYLFQRLKGIFPAWRASIKTTEELDNTRIEWFHALVDARVSRLEQIDDGIRYARQYNSPFWPSTGMFIEWCKQGALDRLGVPDSFDCYKKLVNYQDNTKVRLNQYEYWVWQNMDVHRFKTSDSRDSRKHFDTVYQKMIEAIFNGKKFQSQPAPLEVKPPVEANAKDERWIEENFEALKAQL